MGKLINLAVYNPAILDDNEFLEGFVARQELTERLLSRLREITPKNVARHLLLIGQRGMGKTSMLRRLALGVTQDSALSAVLIPLSFREEQYNVHNLHVFWCNCLDALGDYLENIGQHEQAMQLDREVGKLTSEGSDPDGATACALFKNWCAKQGKRPLLLVDNIDLIFSGLIVQQQWGLRRILQERGGVVIVGASVGLMEDAITVEEPFYDFFQVHQLEKLGHPELLSCLRQIALKRGEAGARVIKVLDSDPARIHTLYDLTGGNPRTLVLLYLLLEFDSEGDVMGDLERLLDQVTVLYKARVEDLAPQTRVVLDAVALAWNPVTVAKIASETGIGASSISSQFDRLMKMGVLEKVTLSTPAPVGYQLGERFFNIWYLMRNSSRRQRNRLRWLTEFLRRLYSPQQISEMADDYIRRRNQNGRCSSTYGMALADAVEDSSLRHALNHMVTKLVQEQADKHKEMDKADLDQTTLTMDEMKKRVLGCKRDWGNTSAEEFWDIIGGSVSLPLSLKHTILIGLKTIPVNEIESYVKSVLEENEKIKMEIGLPEAFECLRQALREGIIESSDNLRFALAASRAYESPVLPLVMIIFTDNLELNLNSDIACQIYDVLHDQFNTCNINFNSLCYFHWGRFLAHNDYIDDAVLAIKKAIELDDNNSEAWNGLGNLLKDEKQMFTEAETAYRKAIEANPTNTICWNNLANLLFVNLDRPDDALSIFHDALKLYPLNGSLWRDLGYLLQTTLNQFEEAETAYRKAIDIDPKDAEGWHCLGILLAHNLNRYEEAEIAIKKAIEFAPNESMNWNNLGNLYMKNLKRYVDAESAFYKAIELDPNNVVSWRNLGNLYATYLGQYDDSETAYRKAIELTPENSNQLNSLGNLLMDHLDRSLDAEVAYRKAIELGDNTMYPRANLAYLLMSQPERIEEAEMAYAEAIILLPEHGRQLLKAFHDMVRDNFGEAMESLSLALEQNHPELFKNYYDDLMRVFRQAKKRGHGERLIIFLQDSGLGERHWPLYAAFDAYLHGEEKLRDVNPEVRSAAQRIFDWLNATPRPAATETIAARKKGRKTTRK